jgi:CRISPR/Cas system CSM-associated protein Csm5 (group 7 of RAMP superfamily)
MEKSKWPSLRLPSKTENVVEDCTEGLTQEDSLIYKRDSPIRAEVNDQQDNSKMGPVSMVDETDVTDRMSMQSIETDRDEEETGWQIHESRKKKKGSRKQIVVASRTSSRVPRDGVPIAEKVAQRAKARNEILGNSSSIPNPFTVLNNVTSSELCSIMHDLDLDGENLEEQVSVFKVEELAWAAIAEANYKQYLERLKDKEKPIEEDFVDGLVMGTITNS